MAEINVSSGELLYGKVLTPDGVIQKGVIAVSEGLIQYAGEAAWLPAAYASWQTGTSPEPEGLLIPGFVDVHVHGGQVMTSCTAMPIHWIPLRASMLPKAQRLCWLQL